MVIKVVCFNAKGMAWFEIYFLKNKSNVYMGIKELDMVSRMFNLLTLFH